MIPLFQAIIAFVLLGLGALYYFKTRSSPETPKSEDDFDPFEDVKAEPDIKPAKPAPAVADEPDINLEPEVIVTPAKPEPENEDVTIKPTPTTTPAKPLVPQKPKPTPKPVVVKPAVPPMKKHYGQACVAPNIIKQWGFPDAAHRPKDPTPEMTEWCHNNPECAFIWSEDNRSQYYACKSTGTFRYQRNYWKPSRLVKGDKLIK